jgi:hypothetical protein
MDERERGAMRGETPGQGDIGENAMAGRYETARSGERREAERRHEERRDGWRGESAARSVISGRAEGHRVDVRGAVGMTRADEAHVNGFSGIVVGGKTNLTGGAPIVAASDEVEIEKGGNILAFAGRKVEVEDHGYVGIAIAPRVEVQDGGKVLITIGAAILGGLAFGVGWAGLLLFAIMRMRRRGLLGSLRARRMMSAGAVGGLTRRARRASVRAQRASMRARRAMQA